MTTMKEGTMNLFNEVRDALKKYLYIPIGGSCDALSALIIASNARPDLELPVVFFCGPRATGKTLARDLVRILTSDGLDTMEEYYFPRGDAVADTLIPVFTSFHNFYGSNFTKFVGDERAQFMESELVSRLAELRGGK